MVSKIEVRDLLISVIVLALAFSKFNLSLFPQNLVIVFLIFVVHEMAHKFSAQRYGCFAEYRMWTWGIALALLSSLTGIIFAAPGATYISPYSRKNKFAFSIVHLTKKEYGKISLAGPLTNIAIGSASLALSFFFPLEFLLTIAAYSFFLAFFNLLPIYPLDGSKVLAWDKRIWAATIVASFIGFVFLVF